MSYDHLARSNGPQTGPVNYSPVEIVKIKGLVGQSGGQVSINPLASSVSCLQVFHLVSFSFGRVDVGGGGGGGVRRRKETIDFQRLKSAGLEGALQLHFSVTTFRGRFVGQNFVYFEVVHFFRPDAVEEVSPSETEENAVGVDVADLGQRRVETPKHQVDVSQK